MAQAAQVYTPDSLMPLDWSMGEAARRHIEGVRSVLERGVAERYLDTETLALLLQEVEIVLGEASAGEVRHAA